MMNCSHGLWEQINYHKLMLENASGLLSYDIYEESDFLKKYCM